MKLLIRNNLPFVTIKVAYRNLSIEIPNILLDTGSATTILNADIISSIGVKPEANDTTAQIVGIGGEESVYHKVIDYIELENKVLYNFKIDVGIVDNVFGIDGILGMDFLIEANAIIDLQRKVIAF